MLKRLHVRVIEPSQKVRGDAPTLLMAHGFGCDQTIWQPLAELLPEARRVLFDWPGAGRAEWAAYDVARHETLDGYAQDLIDLLNHMGGDPPIVVAHSVAASIAALACRQAPHLVTSLAMVSPSPCFWNDSSGYHGGFERRDLEQLVRGLSDGHAAWARAVAPLVMGHPGRPELAADLERRFCVMDPVVAWRWARATFLSDCRPIMSALDVHCLVLQARDDPLAPESVGRWLQAHLPRADYRLLDATGHCAHVSAPAAVASALRPLWT